jgi:uncharacterized protein (DUF58 family)
MPEPLDHAEGVARVATKAAQLRRLELIVTRRLDGLLRGDYLGWQPGPGSDPAGTRPYGTGDDARRIDWNLTARSLSPQLRTTEADRELQTWIVVDRSASLDFGTASYEKRDVAFAAVAAFGFLGARQGNRCGLLVAGGDALVRFAPSSTRPALMAALSKLYDVAPHSGPPNPEANLDAALHRLERTRARRGQLIVISDFLDGSGWADRLRRLGHSHQTLAVQVVDPRELTLPAVGMLALVDAETGRQMHVQTNSKSLRERYETAAAERHERIAAEIRAAGAEHLTLSTDRDWVIDIVKFVASRRAARAGAGRSLAAMRSERSRPRPDAAVLPLKSPEPVGGVS